MTSVRRSAPSSWPLRAAALILSLSASALPQQSPAAQSPTTQSVKPKRKASPTEANAHKPSSGKKNRQSESPYSDYIQRTIDEALQRRGYTLVEQADGQPVESIEIVRFDIIEAQDPAPQQLNWFHATTRHNIVEREVMLQAGSRYDQRLADETERNLRSLGLFSVVVSVAVEGSTPDTVRYLVITKDIWSLRAGWDGRFANGNLDQLSVRPSEINLLGTGRRVSASLAVNPRVVQVGLGAVEPRLGGTRLQITGDFSATINCQTGGVEGYLGSFEYARPLFSTRAQWGFSTSVSLSQGVVRLRGAQDSSLCRADNSGEVALSVDDLDLRDPDKRYALVPNEYTYDTQSFDQQFTRSFGINTKTNLTWGLSVRRTARRTASTDQIRIEPNGTPSQAPLTNDEVNSARNWYLRVVRPSTREVSPYIRLVSFKNQWHRDMHAETLGLQETFRLGPVASLRVYGALEEVGSSRSFFAIDSFVSYATRVGSGYAKVSLSQSTELAEDLTLSNSSLTARLRLTSPRQRWGRFVLDQMYTRSHPNFDRSLQILDNTYRLRGYRAGLRSRELYGSGLAVSNVEFRSRPLQVFSTLLGAVAFYDAGDAFYEDEPWKFRHGAGLGIRFLAPQLDREVLRVDLGFPLNRDDPLGEVTLNATFGQAFGSP